MKNAKTLKYKLKETEKLNAMPTLKLISKKVTGPLVDKVPIKFDKNQPAGIYQF